MPVGDHAWCLSVMGDYLSHRSDHERAHDMASVEGVEGETCTCVPHLRCLEEKCEEGERTEEKKVCRLAGNAERNVMRKRRGGASYKYAGYASKMR